eukprot:1881927-Rhodomonas_salina.2
MPGTDPAYGATQAGSRRERRCVRQVALPSGSLIDYEVNIEDGEWVSWDRKVPAMEVETHKVCL